MPTIVVDASLTTKLAALSEPAEIVSEKGERLGRYIPERAATRPLVPWDPSITREELDRRAESPDGMTLAEFWKQMGRT